MWIIYSAIPPLLLCVYRFFGRGSFLSWLCWLSFLVSSACGFLAILLLWNVYPAEVSHTSRLDFLVALHHYGIEEVTSTGLASQGVLCGGVFVCILTSMRLNDAPPDASLVWELPGKGDVRCE